MTINDSVMGIRMERVTAQSAAAPLNENDSRISRNDFVTFRDAAFKLQKFWASRLAATTDRSRCQYKFNSRKQFIWTAVSRKDCLKCATVKFVYAPSSNFIMIVLSKIVFICFKNKVEVKKFYTFCARVWALAQSDGRFVKV